MLISRYTDSYGRKMACAYLWLCLERIAYFPPVLDTLIEINIFAWICISILYVMTLLALILDQHTYIILYSRAISNRSCHKCQFKLNTCWVSYRPTPYIVYMRGTYKQDLPICTINNLKDTTFGSKHEIHYLQTAFLRSDVWILTI